MMVTAGGMWALLTFCYILFVGKKAIVHQEEDSLDG